MLERVGVDSIDRLYDDVPAEFIYRDEYALRDAMSEQEIREYFDQLDRKNSKLRIFVGAGAYDHCSPAVMLSPSTPKFSFEKSIVMTVLFCEVHINKLRLKSNLFNYSILHL